MSLNFSFNIYSLLIEIFFLFNSCFLLLFSVIVSNYSKFGYLLINKSIQFLFFQILCFGFILSWNQAPIYLITWNNFLILNSFSLYGKIIILIISIFWFLISLKSINIEKINNFEYFILILLNIISILLIVQINDLLSMYLIIEFQSLTFYILASFKRNSEFSTEAGIKYFILGAFSSAFLLFGCSLLYSITGLTNFNDLYIFFIYNEAIFVFSNTIYLSLSFILIAFLFKLHAAPFHMWAPDVYEGAPSSITAFFSLMPKLAILSLLLKFLIIIFYDLINFWSYILIFCIIFSSIIGTFSAFAQIKWKRFIVYSSISHLSFFLIAILSNNLESLNYLFTYLFIYLFMILGFFCFFLNCYLFKFPFFYQIRFLKDINLLTILNPILSFSFILILFSIAGIPPLAGFFSKFFILISSIKYNLFFIIFVVLFCNCIGCFYYIRLIKLSYFNFNLPNIFFVYKSMNQLSAFLLGLCLIFIVLLFFDFELLFLITNLLSLSFL